MSAAVQTTWKEKIANNVEIPILTKCCFCFPLRIGLITFAYLNLGLGIIVTSSLSAYISYIRNTETPLPEEAEYPRLVVDIVALILEMVMNIVFIVALHLKHVITMKVYLYFEIVYSIIGFVYSLAFLTKETASELFLILLQLVMQIYLVILIYSSIVKMKRNVSVNYLRQSDNV